MNNISLVSPVKRATGDISSVGLRKPDVSVLRGLKLTDVLQMDVNALLVLLPRITEPTLLPPEVSALEPADFMTLAGRVISFFLSAEQQAQLETMDRPN